ncbi:hypothetical protein F5146DRAFT_1165666 [Armillaria mellea]|nr:hypothetical protein F5146DRAFT_1165666 [Armillaria mellea]
MLDCDEAERLPAAIPQEDINNDPEAFTWYEGPEGGAMGYLHHILDKCNEYTKNIHSAFFDGIDTYFEGLMEYAMNHYAEFVIPFGTKHRGKQLQGCRDKPWMDWTTKRLDLTQKFSISSTTHAITPRTGTSRTTNTKSTPYNDGPDAEEHEEEESNETADDSEMSSSTERALQSSDVEGSQSGVSDGIDSESRMQTPPHKIPVNPTANLSSAYRLGKRYYSRSSSPTPPSPTSRKRQQEPGTSSVNPVSKGIPGIMTRFTTSSTFPIASSRKRWFAHVDSLDNGAEEEKPEAMQQSRLGKRSKTARRTRKGKQRARTSAMDDSISGNEDYAGSATEKDNLSDLADDAQQKSSTSSGDIQCGITGAQSHQLSSGRKYGRNKSTPSKGTASKELSPRDRGSPRVYQSRDIERPLIPGRTNPTGSARYPLRGEHLAPTLRPCTNISLNSVVETRRTACRVVLSSEDESRSPSPELPARRFWRLRRWSAPA